MKPKIHPTYKKLKVIIGNDTFITSSTLKNDEILMDIDYRKHPAWNKQAGNMVNQSNKTVADFNKKYGGLFASKIGKKEDPTE